MTDSTNRHRQVLDTAMELIAERGLSAASLRELARRVGLSQPSLYHYFRAKEDLVDQIIETYAREVLSLPTEPPPIETLEDFLRFALEQVIQVYRGPTHTTFVRFAFAITMVRPAFGATLKRLVLGRGVALALPFAKKFVDRGEIRPEDAQPMLRTALDAVLMRCIERQVLLSEDGAGDGVDLHAYAAFVADVVARGVRDRARGEVVDD